MPAKTRPPLGNAKDEGICTVYIFDDRVNRVLEEREQIDKPTLLSYAIAHEIGHILLHRNSHSSYGIMQWNWSYRALFEMTGDMLTFHETEAKEMRTEVARRSSSFEQ